MISAAQIKELRDKTGVSMSECKKALEAAGGDLAKALEILREQGVAVAGKKAGRALGAGRVASYLHTTGTMGVLVELACETDFVAKTDEFQAFAADLAMHIGGFAPADAAELLAQPFIKNPELTVGETITGLIQKLGERVELVRFSRLEVGQP